MAKHAKAIKSAPSTAAGFAVNFPAKEPEPALATSDPVSRLERWWNGGERKRVAASIRDAGDSIAAAEVRFPGVGQIIQELE